MRIRNTCCRCCLHVGVIALADGDAPDDVGRLDPRLTQVLGHQVAAHREADADDSSIFVPTWETFYSDLKLRKFVAKTKMGDKDFTVIVAYFSTTNYWTSKLP